MITRHREVAGEGKSDRIDAASQTVAIMAAFNTGRARCLEQSLTPYTCPRWAGIVRFRLGIQPYPFKAHSWVEHRDQPVHEDVERMRATVPLPAIDT